jgi:DNA repair protein RadC
MESAAAISNSPLPPDCRIETGNWTDQDLLAWILELGMAPEQARHLVSRGFEEYGGLRNMVNAALDPPAGCDWQPALNILRACHEMSGRYFLDTVSRGVPLTSPADTLDYLQSSLHARRREVFLCIFLDTRHRVIRHEELFQGSIDGACVYPRVVAEHALRLNAAAVIVAHNHPSGITEPSLADQAITRRLKDALALLEIRLLDHFVIGDGKPVSMASRGML